MPLSPKRQRYNLEHDVQAQIDAQLSSAEEEESSSSSSPLMFSFLSSLSFSSLPVPPSPPLSSSFTYSESSSPSISSSVSSSSCSFHFSYPSTSSASSPLTVDTQDEVEVPVAGTASPPQSPQRSFSVPSLNTLGEDLSTSEWEAGPSTLQASTSTGYLARKPLDEKVTDLVQFLLYKYQMRQSLTKAEMLNVITDNKSQFPVIFQRASNCIKIVFGIDMREVDPTIHSYAFFNSLDLTYDAMPSDAQRVPKNGLLILVLGFIILKGNCVTEEEMWSFLNLLNLYDGREHFIYGEPRQLLTREWVQEMYLEYRQVPYSDPACYEFLWGPRAHAETSKKEVLEFLTMVEGNESSPVSSEYEESLRDEEEKAQVRIAPADSTTAMCQ
ncbi:PREDICTED: melanoma-associated antigen 10-like [Chrysochloris asiatica]|uniref:Melanoma-associated antigen 10-like n=1 Tax=Chrysochloris asiatica TaxID=185453 RepID=A0A9B0X1M0_CHRAS|nr:PREDICTED: melanoma-associated antigen 10-like [Chrysochloris asiatica]